MTKKNNVLTVDISRFGNTRINKKVIYFTSEAAHTVGLLTKKSKSGTIKVRSRQVKNSIPVFKDNEKISSYDSEDFTVYRLSTEVFDLCNEKLEKYFGEVPEKLYINL